MQKSEHKQRWLRKRDVLARFAISNTYLYAQMKKGEFPRSVQFPGTVRWRVEDIEAWETKMEEQSK